MFEFIFGPIGRLLRRDTDSDPEETEGDEEDENDEEDEENV